METAVAPRQVFALATNQNGEVTCAPLAGVVTVIAAAGTHAPNSANSGEIKVFIAFYLLESDCYVPLVAINLRIRPRLAPWQLRFWNCVVLETHEFGQQKPVEIADRLLLITASAVTLCGTHRVLPSTYAGLRVVDHGFVQAFAVGGWDIRSWRMRFPPLLVET